MTIVIIKSIKKIKINQKRSPWLENDSQKQKGGCNTRTSQRVTHSSTTLAQARLTAEF